MIIGENSVVKPQEQPLELRNDGIFIIAGIADQGAANGGGIAGKSFAWGSVPPWIGSPRRNAFPPS